MDLRSQPLRALVVGATGAVGRALVARLLDSPSYGEVRVLVRRPYGLDHPRLVEQIIDFERLAEGDLGTEELDAATSSPARGSGGACHAFCALGTTLKRAGSREAFRRVDFDYALAFARLAAQLGAGRFLLVSSMGAGTNGATFYLRVKGELEAALAELSFANLYLVRPPLLLAERSERRPGEDFAAAVSKLIRPLLAGPLLGLRPMAADAVADALVRLARDDHGRRAVFEADDLHRLIGHREIRGSLRRLSTD